MYLLTFVVSFFVLASGGNIDKPGYLGCFKDPNQKLMLGIWTSSAKNSIGWCSGLCRHYNYQYAAVEDTTYCFCSNSVTGTSGQEVDNSECNSPCFADKTEKCGGKNRAGIYKLTGNLGCFDNSNNNALREEWFSDDDMTIELCVNGCKSQGFRYAGLQNGNECMCGYGIGTNPVPETKCSEACAAKSDEKCGGKTSTSIYYIANYNSYLGCWKDSPSDRMMGLVKTHEYMNGRWCRYECQGMTYGGLENGDSCYCSDKVDLSSYDRRQDADCQQPCGGNPRDTCGGDIRLALFKNN